MIQSVDLIETATRVVNKGTDVVLECHLCNANQIKWTYKPINGIQEDIVENNNIIRNENHGKETWITIEHNSNCTYNLFLPKIQFGGAGIYSCWEGSVEKRIIHTIVTSDCFYQNLLNQTDHSYKKSYIGFNFFY